MSSGWVLTLTPPAARAGAERLGLGPDGFMELTGEILSVCDVETRVGSMRDSERDRLPEWFFVLQDLPSTGVVIPEVHVPMTLEVALACSERGVEVDAWLVSFQEALRVVWGSGVRVFLDRAGRGSS